MSVGWNDLINITLIGRSAVGKHCLMIRYIKDSFKEGTPLVLGPMFYDKKIRIENIDVVLRLWKMSGYERSWQACKSIWKNADGYILVYDEDQTYSFKSVPQYISDVRKENKVGPIIVVQNKSDLIKEGAPTKSISSFKCETMYNVDFIKTSAKTGENVHKVFDMMARRIFNVKHPPSSKLDAITSTEKISKRLYLYL